MITDNYSHALYEALKVGTPADTAFSRLASLLKQEGHASLYGRILKETLERFNKDEKRATLTVRVAHAKDAASFKKEIDSLKKEMHASEVAVVIDSTIIGGFIASGDEVRLDASYKKSLLSVYQALTA